MLTINRLLFPTDFSESARHARPLAERLAARHGAELHVLHVTAHRDLVTWLPTLAGGHLEAEDVEAARRLYAHASKAMSAAVNAPTATPREETEMLQPLFSLEHAGTPAKGILSYAEEHDIDVVVMGTHGRSGLNRFALGSVTDEVLRRVACPVLTVRSDAAQTSADEIRRILVPVDFSEPSRYLIGHARALAAAWRAQVDLLYVVEEPRFPTFYRIDNFRAALPGIALRAREALKELAEETEGSYVPLRYQALTGEPAREITRYADAQRADLVLMATHGRTGLKRLAVGSVAEHVVRTAPCPVGVVKSYGKSLLLAPDEASPPSASDRAKKAAPSDPRFRARTYPSTDASSNAA